jgi:Uma2 family endonuclease
MGHYSRKIRFASHCRDWKTGRFVPPLAGQKGRLPAAPIAALLVSMSGPYEEILDGGSLPRSAPGARHEMICGRLHAAMTASVANLSSTRLLAPRTQVRVSRTTALCPDLALVTSATGKLWLAVEIVSREDHHTDTVLKKQIYEDIRVPRLWMVDPRYDNVEIYHSTEWGLVLKGILAGSEVLAEALVPEFQIVIAELFVTPPVV